MTDLLTRRLEAAAAGLLFPSETDAPLRVFVWHAPPPFSPEALRGGGGGDLAAPIATTDVDHFFGPVLTTQPWHGPEEQTRQERFSELVTLLKTELSELTVYKVGQRRITVYVLGRTADDTYLGITTEVVET